MQPSCLVGTSGAFWKPEAVPKPIEMRILLAVDTSPASEMTARTISLRPWPEGSTLRILSVAENPFPLAPDAAAGAIAWDDLRRSRRREAEALVERNARALGAIMAVETTVREGDPRLAIVDEAAKWRADLVLLGSHGRTGLKRLLLGSVAEYVVRHAPCSVEIARMSSGC
jgi:nucleotide-binding universal stress UspA family protein